MNIIRFENKSEFKYIRLLAMVYITFLMAATIMAYKVVDVNGIYTPGSTLIYTFTFFLGNVYAELYGEKYARKLIWESMRISVGTNIHFGFTRTVIPVLSERLLRI